MIRCLLALFLAVTMPLATSAPAVAAQAQDAKPSPSVPTVNVNTGTVEQFEALPGIGPSMARRIVAYRDKNGPFKKLEDLMNVQGIGEKSFLKLRQHLSLTQAADARPAKG